MCIRDRPLAEWRQTRGSRLTRSVPSITPRSPPHDRHCDDCQHTRCRFHDTGLPIDVTLDTSDWELPAVSEVLVGVGRLQRLVVTPPAEDGAMKNQLTLLEPTIDWRLDEETREVGRRGIAAARAALAAAHSTTITAPVQHRSAA